MVMVPRRRHNLDTYNIAKKPRTYRKFICLVWSLTHELVLKLSTVRIPTSILTLLKAKIYSKDLHVEDKICWTNPSSSSDPVSPALTVIMSLTARIGVTVTALSVALDIISSEAKDEAANVRGVSIPPVSFITAVYSNCIKPPLMLEGLETCPRSQLICSRLLVTLRMETSDKLADIGD